MDGLSISLESCWLCRLCCQIISIVDKFPLYLSLRGFLHEKTRTSARFMAGWLFHFVSRLHNDWVISYLDIWRYTSSWWNTYVIQNRKHCACATHSSLSADWFHPETCGQFAFTWYRCEISYQSEILTPATRVNSHQGNLPWHDILWWYHVTNVEPWEVAFFCMNPEGGEWRWWKVFKNIISILVYFIILLLWVTELVELRVKVETALLHG